MTNIRELAEYIYALTIDDLPVEIINIAEIRIIDTIATGIAARNEEEIKNILKEYLQISGSAKNVSSWGDNKKVPLLTGVFINALKAHLYELDDVHTESKSHIGAVVIPTAWGVAEYLGKSGKELVEAIICGYEVEARIAMSLNVINHRNKGWHVSGTAGIFGAAATASKLFGIDVEKIISAFGMAGTQSAGLWGFLEEGSNCKPLNLARAATSGTESAILAKSGMIGPESVLDAEDGGVYAAMTDNPLPNLLTRGLGEKYEIIYADIKPYPSCRSTHGSIDAAKKIIADNKPDLNKIKCINVYIHMNGYKQCGATESSIKPQTPFNARFSIPYVITRVFMGDTINLDSFAKDKVCDPSISDFMDKVKVYPCESYTEQYPQKWVTRMEVNMCEGSHFEVTVDSVKGSKNISIFDDDFNNKIASLIGEESREKLMNNIKGISKVTKLPSLSI